MTRIETIIVVTVIAALGMGCQKSGFQLRAPASELLQSELPSTSRGSIVPLAGEPGSKAADCMANAAFDTCIFMKNPVAQRGVAFISALGMGSDLSVDQIYGATLENQILKDSLSSKSIRVVASSGQTARPIGGKWKFAYKDDAGTSYVAQLMAYVWLTFQEKEMEKRVGVFYAKGKNIQVDAYDSTVENNAYWDGTKIVLGRANVNGRQHEMAMSAEVYLHEMGHANLENATSANLFLDANSDDGQHCRTDQGCIGAINEGQADFHYLMMFPGQTSLGETWLNSVNGLASRDVKRVSTLSVTDFYRGTAVPGEIHVMGTAYASILYSIYTSSQMSKADFEKLFVLHLQQLTGRSRFADARDVFIANDAAFFGGKYSSLIRQAFTSRGVL